MRTFANYRVPNFRVNFFFISEYHCPANLPHTTFPLPDIIHRKVVCFRPLRPVAKCAPLPRKRLRLPAPPCSRPDTFIWHCVAPSSAAITTATTHILAQPVWMPAPLCLESGFPNPTSPLVTFSPPGSPLVIEMPQRLFSCSVASVYLRRTRSARSFASLRMRHEISYPRCGPTSRASVECPSSLSLRRCTDDMFRSRQLAKHALLVGPSMPIRPASHT
ncbi:hypothetical protein B0H19DRAFT_78140 [Mycena capillaripes]|nr:hypothetical protein B0H19DRAFT_78140 [Mycena capillaripes]